MDRGYEYSERCLLRDCENRIQVQGSDQVKRAVVRQQKGGSRDMIKVKQSKVKWGTQK